LGGHFDLDNKKKDIKELESKINNQDIWNNVDEANKLVMKLSNIKKDVMIYDNMATTIEDDIALLDILDDEEDTSSIEHDLNRLKNDIHEFEVKTLLNDEFDSYNCYLEIHPGAGGTESCDWSSMLFRMYTMFLDKFGYKYEIVDSQAGDVAGLKSVMIHIIGPYAYGYLKSEIGVHRLVRISPFDSNARRHTSFAAVNVTPEIENIPKDIEVKDEDIRIDITRASGNGGQGVNTTDSAVRISHIPTGIVIYAQTERSQIKNKEIAMKILKSKLYQLEVQKRHDEINSLKNDSAIDFGSQIRNYVLEPYTLVKDVRTNYQTTQVDKVLDGDIYPFIESYIRMKRG
jgi:peptide chain release factor 2